MFILGQVRLYRQLALLRRFRKGIMIGPRQGQKEGKNSPHIVYNNPRSSIKPESAPDPIFQSKHCYKLIISVRTLLRMCLIFYIKKIHEKKGFLKIGRGNIDRKTKVCFLSRRIMAHPVNNIIQLMYWNLVQCTVNCSWNRSFKKISIIRDARCKTDQRI